MNERLLQFIWQFQYFNRSVLATTNGDSIEILTPGTLNNNQGPDFLNAKLKLGNTIWVGSVELHVKSSDWVKHRHNSDSNYRNVILHVVYEHDDKRSELPVLELKERIAVNLLDHYKSLMQSKTIIPCENLIHTVSDLTISTWKERMVVERLYQKTESVNRFLNQTKQHWEESFWWLLAKNFGTKLNSEAFGEIAKSIPLNIIAKHKSQIIQLEALLLGQSGLLNIQTSDKYVLLLQREYKFLKEKYKLKQPNIQVHFLRMRPGNFPTLRLAQLAALIAKSTHLFSTIIEENELAEIRKLFNVTPNDFWNYHYSLQNTTHFKQKSIGNEMIDNIITNTIVPLIFSYGHTHLNQDIKNKAMRWLQLVKPEKNSITKAFEKLQLINKSAWDSQAFIQLKTQYCNAKLCLHCAIGNAVIKH